MTEKLIDRVPGSGSGDTSLAMGFQFLATRLQAGRRRNRDIFSAVPLSIIAVYVFPARYALEGLERKYKGE